MMNLEMSDRSTIIQGRPAGWRNCQEGQALAGFPIGILCISGASGLIPGNVQNACTFRFPVLYQVIPDVQFSQIAKGDPAVTPLIIAAAKDLATNGVRAIIGACGSLGHYQRAVANAVDVPVFMSILTQVPLVLNSLGRTKRLAIVFATTGAFTPLVRSECEINEIDRIVPIGLDICPAFQDLTKPDLPCDGNALVSQIISQIEQSLDESVGALLLQCSDLPPFAYELQQHFKLPVFDMTGLIDWIYGCVIRRPFAGHF